MSDGCEKRESCSGCQLSCRIRDASIEQFLRGDEPTPERISKWRLQNLTASVNDEHPPCWSWLTCKEAVDAIHAERTRVHELEAENEQLVRVISHVYDDLCPPNRQQHDCGRDRLHLALKEHHERKAALGTQPTTDSDLPEGAKSDSQASRGYTHDCDKCVFIGMAGQYDCYLCDSGIGGDVWGGSTLVLRYGSDGPEYVSGPVRALPVTKSLVTSVLTDKTSDDV